MWHIITVGGPIMFVLIFTSIVGLAFIIERGLALRWTKVIPPRVVSAMNDLTSPEDIPRLIQISQSQPSTLSRLLILACEHLRWPRAENALALETRARREVANLERGLVVLEIVVGISPLLGLIGTIWGLITLFGDLSRIGLGDNSLLARGIGIALYTTLAGLLIAVPSLVAWSYYTKKVERFAVELEALCEEFLRRQYRRK